MNKQYRVNNIGFMIGGNGSLHIVKYYKNQYFGNFDKMVSEGWVPNKEGGLYKDCVTITESCFKNPESCYTVAFLELDEDEYTTNLTTVGDRVLDLNKSGRDDFFKVYKKAHKYLLKQIKDQLPCPLRSGFEGKP